MYAGRRPRSSTARAATRTRELGERAWRLANALRAAGVQKGDRVATLLPNCPAMLEAHFGVPAAGGILVTVNTRLSGAEVEYILESLRGPARCCSTLELADVVAAARPRRHRGDAGGRQRCARGDPYEDILAASSPDDR